MTEPTTSDLLAVSNLTIEYLGSETVRAVDRVSFALGRGACLGVVGESGSGKTTLGLALAGLLPKSARLAGSIEYEGLQVVGLPERRLRELRGHKVGVVFQDAKTALDPVRTIGSQISEAVRAHRRLSRQESLGIALGLLREVELPDPEHRLRQYPHELSGGQRQRAMIAMALAGEPKLLIADEPTSALDVTTQAKIVSLLERLGHERGMATILITHDLGVVAGFASEVLVMYAGAAVEHGPVVPIFERPGHPYTRALIESVPSLTRTPTRRLAFIPGTLPRGDAVAGRCRFEPRCTTGHGNPTCESSEPAIRALPTGTFAACYFPVATPLRDGGPSDTTNGAAGGPSQAEARLRPTILEVVELVKTFRIRRGSGSAVNLRAVTAVSLSVRAGESFGIVGESGSGKTTLARIIVGLETADSGTLQFDGRQVDAGSRRRRGREWRAGEIQMIFQDPGDSLDPLLEVERLVAEPLEITRGGSFRRYRREVADSLAAVGLSAPMMKRRASELSGGQRQRVAVARALTTHPRLLVADEAVASLDMSARGQVLNLLSEIQEERDLTCIHISHDLSLVRNVCERVAVMHAGRVVEIADAEELFRSPRHPYTAGLISAIPVPDPSYEHERARVDVVGELPDPTRRLAGCAYRTRCPNAGARCETDDPALLEGSPDHSWACHFPEPVALEASVGARLPTSTPSAMTDVAP